MIKNIYFDNIKIHSESFGNKNDQAILLIMGAASSSVWWEEKFCQMLVDKGFFVIKYDNRDTGKSTCYEPGQPKYSFENMAEDAIQVLDAYKIERAIIMGMSMGGFIAQIIGVKYPSRVKGLVLLSTMYFAENANKLRYSSDAVNEFLSTFGKVELNSIDELVEYSMKMWMVTSKSNRKKDIDRYYIMIRHDIERADSYASRINHSFVQITGDELMRIKEINAPVLVIHGDLDEVISFDHAIMLSKTIPNAKLQTMTGAGHEINESDYEDIVEGIINYLV